MDETALSQAVRTWYESYRVRARIEPPPITVHLDELLRAGYDRNDAVAQGLACFKELHRCWRDDDVVPLLVVSLRDSETIDCSPPSWAEAQRLLGDAPPSLYLIDPMVSWLVSTEEEYRCPVAVPIDAELPECSSSFFRSHRSAETRAQGWEFAASLYLSADARRDRGV